MGILDRLFRRKRHKPEALESVLEKTKALQQSIELLQAQPSDLSAKKEILFSENPEIHKDSLQLGLAAGYAGRSLKEIESSLGRIESQMVTKDWFTSKFEDRTPELIDIMDKHEDSDQKRYETIFNALRSLQKTAESAPEPVKEDILTQIRDIETQIPLTKRMSDLLSFVKDTKEISYSELASRLGIKVSALRGLLTSMVRRTNKIERFTRGGKGWVRYLSADSSD